MKKPWQKSEQTTSGSTKVELPSAAEPAKGAGVVEGGVDKHDAPNLPKGYTPPKGRPTPKRHDQEVKRGVVRDPNAMTPEQARQKRKELKKTMSKEEWKQYRKTEREENRASNRKIQERIDAGDERYLQKRDQGEVRRYVRDWVDARRFANNYAFPFAMVLLAVMFFSTFIPRLASVLSIVAMVFILVILIEMFIIGRRANAAVRKRFPNTTDTGFGLGMYASSRASQPRSWRSPKPQVAIGDKV